MITDEPIKSEIVEGHGIQADASFKFKNTPKFIFLSIFLLLGATLKYPLMYDIVQKIFEGFINTLVISFMSAIITFSSVYLFYQLWYRFWRGHLSVWSDAIISFTIIPKYLVFTLIMSFPLSSTLTISSPWGFILHFTIAVFVAEAAAVFQLLVANKAADQNLERLAGVILKPLLWNIIVYEVFASMIFFNNQNQIYSLGHVLIGVFGLHYLSWMGLAAGGMIILYLKSLLASHHDANHQ